MISVRTIGRLAATNAALGIAMLGWATNIAQAQRPAPRPTGSPTATAGNPTATAGNVATMDEAARRAEAALAAPSAPTEAPPLPPREKPQINLWQLANDGGPLMFPIYGLSIVVVCFAFERAFALRRRKLLPPALVRELGELSKRGGGVDPRAAYRACQRYPSTASTVLKGVLLKIGRPFAELEETLKESSEREASRLYKNVRPIELTISIAPLLGLLGTVQGMILAFFVTANAEIETNKAEALAQGIYVALVTTFAGLCVAIPAAVLAHYFEGRIQEFFRELEELVLGFLPQWERYEGKLRVNRATLSGEADAPPAVEPPPVERQPAPVGRT